MFAGYATEEGEDPLAWRRWTAGTKRNSGVPAVSDPEAAHGDRKGRPKWQDAQVVNTDRECTLVVTEGLWHDRCSWCSLLRENAEYMWGFRNAGKAGQCSEKLASRKCYNKRSYCGDRPRVWESLYDPRRSPV